MNAQKDFELAYRTDVGMDPEVKKQYLADYHRLSIEALNNYPAFENLPYGPDEDQILDIMLPKTSKNKAKPATKLPLVVSIHGGYWQGQTHKDGSSMAEVFLNQNLAFASIHYRLCPKVKLTQIVEDCSMAMGFLIKQAEKYGYDANQIHLIGHSAGAHLAMCMLKHFKIKGALLISGVYDLHPIQFTTVNNKVKISEQEIENLSLLSPHRSNQTTKVMICYGGLESSEFERQSVEMNALYQQSGLKTLLKGYAPLNHFDIVLELNEPKSAIHQDCFRFLFGA